MNMFWQMLICDTEIFTLHVHNQISIHMSLLQNSLSQIFHSLSLTKSQAIHYLSEIYIYSPQVSSPTVSGWPDILQLFSLSIKVTNVIIIQLSSIFGLHPDIQTKYM